MFFVFFTLVFFAERIKLMQYLLPLNLIVLSHILSPFPQDLWHSSVPEERVISSVKD